MRLQHALEQEVPGIQIIGQHVAEGDPTTVPYDPHGAALITDRHAGKIVT
ncbi:MAG: hypothetical protein AAGF33_00250 [Pseudomonadota bacterium]